MTEVGLRANNFLKFSVLAWEWFFRGPVDIEWTVYVGCSVVNDVISWNELGLGALLILVGDTGHWVTILFVDARSDSVLHHSVWVDASWRLNIECCHVKFVVWWVNVSFSVVGEACPEGTVVLITLVGARVFL